MSANIEELTTTPEKGYVINCYIEAKNRDEMLFSGNSNDECIAYLDGYAIIPIAKYEAMKDNSGR